MQAAVNRKLRNARRLRGTVDLVVIPMAFRRPALVTRVESQGGLHPNWRTTYLEWAKIWASRSEAERPRWRQFLMVQSWIARTWSLDAYLDLEFKRVCRLSPRHACFCFPCPCASDCRHSLLIASSLPLPNRPAVSSATTCSKYP